MSVLLSLRQYSVLGNDNVAQHQFAGFRIEEISALFIDAGEIRRGVIAQGRYRQEDSEGSEDRDSDILRFGDRYPWNNRF